MLRNTRDRFKNGHGFIMRLRWKKKKKPIVLIVQYVWKLLRGEILCSHYKENCFILFFLFVVSVWGDEMMYVMMYGCSSEPLRSSSHIEVNQTIMLSALHLYSDFCQLFLSKLEKNTSIQVLKTRRINKYIIVCYGIDDYRNENESMWHHGWITQTQNWHRGMWAAGTLTKCQKQIKPPRLVRHSQVVKLQISRLLLILREEGIKVSGVLEILFFIFN